MPDTDRDDSNMIDFVERHRIECRPVEDCYWEATREGFRWVKRKTLRACIDALMDDRGPRS